MYRTTTISVRGIYALHPTLFDGIQPPEGLTLAQIRDKILLDCADLEILYPSGPVLQQAITLWAESESTNWARMAQALQEEYDPLHNYDRHEEYDDSSQAEATGAVQSYNGDKLTDAQRTRSSGSGKRTGHTYGNIGVTTSAQMLEGEISVRMQYNLLELIVQQFRQRFCLLVY